MGAEERVQVILFKYYIDFFFINSYNISQLLSDYPFVSMIIIELLECQSVEVSSFVNPFNVSKKNHKPTIACI